MKLVLEDLESQPCIELGVVQTPALKLAVLIVFYQVVVRIAREGERIELERIDARQLQDFQIRSGRHQVDRVEGDKIVSEQEARAIREAIELA